MTKSRKTFTVNLKRVIAGSPADVFDAWLDPKRPCNVWNHCKNVILDPKAGKLFFFQGRHSNGAHFGRILKLARAKQFKHTWMSFYTRGVETTVTVDFKRHAAGTLMTLRHGGLSNDDYGRSHMDGWNHFLGKIEKHFAAKSS